MAGADTMKWKMSDRSLFAILLRSPWWMSFLLVAAISLASSALLPTEYKVVGALCSLPFAVIGAMAAWRQRNLLSPAQADALQSAMAAMHWREFSPLLSQAFVHQGYTVTALSQGLADFKLTRQGQTTLVCAKRWKAAAWGMDNLQALLSERDARDATHLMCVSLQAMPQALKSFAAQNRVTWLTEQSLWSSVAPVYPSNSSKP
jgi:restriction system protein